MKTNRFDCFMSSDPEHLIFVYSPLQKHIRLLQLQKCQQQTSQQNQYSGLIDSTIINETRSYMFSPRRCVMLDSHLATIQKQSEGKPISYDKKYQKLFDKELKSRIFNWYADEEQIIIQHDETRQYYSYKEITNFCFGRRHFVRALNSIELASDHISRDHCQLTIQKGKNKSEIMKYFNLLFGVGMADNCNSNKITENTLYSKNPKKTKLSKLNPLNFLSTQLWQKIYSYIFLTRDKYYLIDNGSRNGTFFIEAAVKESQCSKETEYTGYGNRVQASQRLRIREGFSYEFEGQEYLMKVWRLTEHKDSFQQTTISSTKRANTSSNPHQQQQHNIIGSVKYLQSIYTSSSLITSNPSCKNFDQPQPSPHYPLLNRQTILNIQQFQEKINWYNNFQKVNKEYIIDETLLQRTKWKGKRVYDDMIRDRDTRIRDTLLNFYRTQQSSSRSLSSSNSQQHSASLQPQPQPHPLNPPSIVQRQPSQSYLPFNIPRHSITSEPSLISKKQFVLLIYKQWLYLQQIIKSLALKQQLLDPFLMIKEPLFILQHEISAMVMSLDFSNDFKKLYCIITDSKNKNRFHIGSQMPISTARFQFDDFNRSSGYVEFDGTQWSLVALRLKNTIPVENIHQSVSSISSDSEADQQDCQQSTDYESREYSLLSGFSSKLLGRKNKGKQRKINLQNQLSDKIWTKIASGSRYELNPQVCSRYILRLAHSFYFQLKFINYFNDTHEHQQYNVSLL